VPYAELGLKFLGIAMAALSWACLAFPDIRITWKGGNRAPLSRSSKLTMAVGWTAWCCAVFRFHPLFFAGVFAASVLLGFAQTTRDRVAFDTSRGIRKISRVLTLSSYWPALCMIDAFILTVSLYAVLRDAFYPPQTQEQRIVHIMGICYLVVSSLGAVFLYIKRPEKDREK